MRSEIQHRKKYLYTTIYNAIPTLWPLDKYLIAILELLLFSHSVMSNSFVTPTVAHQAPLPIGFPRKEYWSGFPSPFHSLLHGIFLTQGLKPHLLHWQADSLPLSHQGSPPTLETTS